MFTCSVKGVVGVEDSCEEAEGESPDAERHVKASVPETLKHLTVKTTGLRHTIHKRDYCSYELNQWM